MFSQPVHPPDLRSDDQKLRGLNRLLIFMVVFGAINLFMTVYNLASAFNRDEIVIHVVENEAPTTCWVGTGRESWHRQRSSTPRYDFQGFCGYILTDHGTFTVPQTSWFHPFEEPRADIVTTLRPHCDYRVVIAGFGATPTLDIRYRNGPVKTIVRVLGTEHCDLHL